MTPIHRLFLLPLLLLAGCTSTERAAIHVNISSIAMTDASIAASEAVFTLRITNEALFPVVVERDSHKIYIDGSFVCEATNTETYALPQLGVVSRVVRAQVPDGAAGERLRAAIRQGGGAYRIESRLQTNAGGERMTLTNASSGTFKIEGK